MQFKESEAALLGKCFEDTLEGKQWEFVDVTPATLINAINDPVEKPRATKHNEAVEIIKLGSKVAPKSFIEKLDRMRENAYKAIVTKGKFEGIKASDVLTGEYQVERYGTYSDFYNEIPIKAKFDILHDGLIFDLKTTSNISGFKWNYRDGYWVQDFIYSELNDLQRTPLIFLVVESVEPYTSQFIYRHGDFEAWQTSIFNNRLIDFWEWKKDKKSVGYRGTELL
jgi:hypothetical protein